MDFGTNPIWSVIYAFLVMICGKLVFRVLVFLGFVWLTYHFNIDLGSFFQSVLNNDLSSFAGSIAGANAVAILKMCGVFDAFHYLSSALSANIALRLVLGRLTFKGLSNS